MGDLVRLEELIGRLPELPRGEEAQAGQIMELQHAHRAAGEALRQRVEAAAEKLEELQAAYALLTTISLQALVDERGRGGVSGAVGKMEDGAEHPLTVAHVPTI